MNGRLPLGSDSITVLVHIGPAHVTELGTTGVDIAVPLILGLTLALLGSMLLSVEGR
ncbi:hypothetical protein HQQ80_19315 [Microbacteriaceae bacterium VKM Ac-2855]|nr:hypothetical protein [Microbacteriaceae bacterium VKM Ac-2855]